MSALPPPPSPPPPPPPPPSPFVTVIGIPNSNTDDVVRNHTPSPAAPSHSSLDKLRPTIIIIFLVLTITILLSISLCLLLRHLNRRCLRHLSSSSSSTVLHSDSRPHSSRRISPHNHTCSVIDSLPIFTYSSITRPSSTAGDCAVCLSKFQPQDQLRLLPLCCHAFHVHCIDTWLDFNQTCPLCRSPILASESDFVKPVQESAADAASFRIEIGSVSSRRQGNSETGREAQPRSYSIGSYDYIVDEASDISVSTNNRRSVSDKEESQRDIYMDRNLAWEVGGAGRSWLKEYVDRLSFSVSSRAASFRGSGRFFTGSSRRSDITISEEYEVEATRAGEEISEMFRWLSGV